MIGLFDDLDRGLDPERERSLLNLPETVALAREAARRSVVLFIRDRVASLTRPVRELKNFSQIELAGGESREVSFELTREDLSFVNAQFKRAAEPGRFEVWIAPLATTGIPAQFTLI